MEYSFLKPEFQLMCNGTDIAVCAGPLLSENNTKVRIEKCMKKCWPMCDTVHYKKMVSFVHPGRALLSFQFFCLQISS